VAVTTDPPRVHTVAAVTAPASEAAAAVVAAATAVDPVVETEAVGRVLVRTNTGAAVAAADPPRVHTRVATLNRSALVGAAAVVISATTGKAAEARAVTNEDASRTPAENTVNETSNSTLAARVVVALAAGGVNERANTRVARTVGHVMRSTSFC
jgi:hypothetical protein